LGRTGSFTRESLIAFALHVHRGKLLGIIQPSREAAMTTGAAENRAAVKTALDELTAGLDGKCPAPGVEQMTARIANRRNPACPASS